MSEPAPQIDWLDKLTDFAVEHGKDGCFVGWPREFVKQYIAFHHLQRTLALVMDGDEIVAMGTAKQCNPEEAGENWEWKPTNPFGKHLVILDVISTRKGSITLLFNQMFTLWPPGTVEKVYALRKKGLVELTPRYIQLAASNA